MRKIYAGLRIIKACLFLIMSGPLFLGAQAPVTLTFTYTGATQTFVVPSCVASMTIDARAAKGGDAGYTGASGGAVRGVITATPGQLMYFNVGGRGSLMAGGFNGGGNGGIGSSTSGAGGGGASDVRIGGNALSNRIIVAGAGGGSGGSSNYNAHGGTGGGGTSCSSPLGVGGGLGTGFGSGNSSGGCAGGTGPNYASPGSGGGLTSGGGLSGSGSGGYGAAGTLGNGGGGGDYAGTYGGGGGGSNGGGGGGAGYYGGSGGMSGSGGGNGGGGGGSSYADNSLFSSVTFTGGVSSGDGTITIIYSSVGMGVSATASSTSICNGASVTLTGISVQTYTWLPVGTFAGSNASAIVVTPSATTNYTVKGTNALNCISQSVITITVSQGLPTLSVTVTPSNSVCYGKKITIKATGALTYTWTGGISNGQGFLPTATTSYTVSGQNGCGISQMVTTVTVSPVSVSVQATPTLVCVGKPSTLTATSAVNGYTWHPSVFVLGSITIVSPSISTIYTVAASNGTCIGTATLAVFTKANPTITSVSTSSLICPGDSVTITASGGTTYTWTPGNLSGPTITVSPAAPSLYQVAGSNTLNCIGYDSQIVLVNPATTVVAAASKTLVCKGYPATLTASGASTYTWMTGPPGATYTINPQSTGVYSVAGTNTNTGCEDTGTITVSVFSPSVAVSTPSSNICDGDNTHLIATGAGTYVWSNNAGSGPNVIVSPTVTTIYTVSAKTISNTVNCPSTNTISITVFNNPAITIAATKTIMCKRDADAKLEAHGGTAYVWGAAETTPTISASSAVVGMSTYTVTGTDANGCVNTATIQMNVNTCTGIEERSSSQNVFTIYPNPANDVFIIKSASDMHLKLMNEFGQELRTLDLSGHNDQTLIISDLADGVYFVIGQGETVKVSQKVVIIH